LSNSEAKPRVRVRPELIKRVERRLIRSSNRGAVKPITDDDLDLLEDLYALEARDNLWAFRQYVDSSLIRGWWVAEVSRQFQVFYERMEKGERPKLIMEAPPQHGKTRGLQDAVSWMSGKNPNLKTIYASFSDELGVGTNTYLQRLMTTDKYQRVFPDTRLAAEGGDGDGGSWARNSKLLEFVGARGMFRNATVQGQITGKSLDLGVIDDPLKGREAAQSKNIRDKTWMWLMDDFFSRFSEHAGLIITMTRWHVDDPVGRFQNYFPDAVVLKYPAEYAPTPQGMRNNAWDPRQPGEPLFPEYKSTAFLQERKSIYTQASWQSLYQQMPIVSGGGMFPIEKFKLVSNPPAAADIKKSVRYWDKAGTEAGGAFTCGVLAHLLHDGRTVISDVKRGQWSSWDRERHIKAATEADEIKHGRVETWVEQEPGSGGKESAERTIAMLRGFPVFADKVTGSKELRAEPYAAQVQGGTVMLVNGLWTQPFVDEHEVFPTGKYKDQVDAAAGAFTKMTTKKYKYDSTLSWVDGPTTE
jgi:predicted phage terminase large subunit-like protein